MLMRILEMLMSLFGKQEMLQGRRESDGKQGLQPPKYSVKKPTPVKESTNVYDIVKDKGYKFSSTSKSRLETCHKDIQRLMHECIKEYDFTVLQGYRGKKEQDAAYDKGFSKLKFPKSRHNQQPSEAIDIAPYKAGVGVDWDDIKAFQKLAEIVKRKAKELDIKIEHGGDWKWKDYPHWQLPRK